MFGVFDGGSVVVVMVAVYVYVYVCVVFREVLFVLKNSKYIHTF